jgi:threonine synthase
MTDSAYQRCINPDCGRTFDLAQALFACDHCGELIDVAYDWSRVRVPDKLGFFDERRGARSSFGGGQLDYSGVWRFRELLPFAEPDALVTLGEGRTILQQADALATEVGLKPGRLFLQYEGMNPSGSFKDNGMAAACTMARMLGRSRVACASTGNTSASMALFASRATCTAGDEPIEAVVFIGSGRIAFGKLSQALAYGARTIQIEGDFDACWRRVCELADRAGIYLMNSTNPFRLEGQKTIMYRVLEGLAWEVPDWIVVPGGNLGNNSAFGKAFAELLELGLIRRPPRVAVINAVGANTLYELVNERRLCWRDGRFDRGVVETYYSEMKSAGRRARTVASAIEIGRPVNLPKSLRTLAVTDGLVRQVPDDEILDHKALIGRMGFGCEPASAASVAGLRQLVSEQIVGRDERVVCILTGHELKDPDATVRYHGGADTGGGAACSGRYANMPVKIKNDWDEICRALGL